MSNEISRTYLDGLKKISHQDILSEDTAESLILLQFRAFYAELLRIKLQVERGTYVSSVLEDEEDDGGARDIQQQLMSIFHTHEQEASREGGAPLQKRCKRAQYAMAALADEILLNIDWRGWEYWYNNLLEMRRFNSQNAGERVFQIIDDLIEDRSPPTDVTAVYLYTIVLGFEGQYRDDTDRTPIEERQRQLYQKLRSQEAQRLTGDQPLSTEAYRYTLDGGRIQLLPNLRAWVGSFGLVFAAYLVVSTIIWWWYTTDLANLAQQIIGMP